MCYSPRVAEVLFTDRVYWQRNRFLGGLLWSCVMVVGGGLAAVFAPYLLLKILGWVLAAVGGLFVYVALNFRVLNVRVTTEAVEFSLGLFRRRIPLANITVMGMRTYKQQSRFSPAWGMMTVAEGPDIYTTFGGMGDAVAIMATDSRNKTRRYLVSTHDTAKFLGAIIKAQGGLPVPPPHPLKVLQPEA